MQNNIIINKLNEMHLNMMAKAYREQLKDNSYRSMSFEDRFQLLVDAEWSTRMSSRLTRLIKNSDYVYNDACIENIEYTSERQLDKVKILRLASCNYIAENQNIIIYGPAGCGKTYVATAFGMAANRNYYTVRYIRLPDLLSKLAAARSDGTYHKIIKQFKQVKLLILDEWLLSSLTENELKDILEILKSRCRGASTIFCSQLELNDWYLKIGESTMAYAIFDNIIHDAYSIVICGNSF
jgi:DNA replication protein DnaC